MIALQKSIEAYSIPFRIFCDHIKRETKFLKAHQGIIQGALQNASAIAKHFTAVREHEKTINENLLRHGFFLFPYLDNFDARDIDQFADYSKRELIEFFIRTFSENNYWHLRHVFAKQHESIFFKERAVLLDHCITAHTMQMYALTIPTLLPLIENIILRILKLPENKGTIAQKSQKNKHKKAFFRLVPKVDFLNGLLFEQFILEIFQITKENASILLHRNPILHGYGKGYATEINSLFLFFVLNFLFQIEIAHAN